MRSTCSRKSNTCFYHRVCKSLFFFVHYIYTTHTIIVKLDHVRTRNKNCLNSVICSSIHCSRSFENTAWNDSFKWPMIQILWALSILSFFVLPAKWLFCKTTWYVVFAKIFWMPTLPTEWLQSKNISMLGSWFSVMM